MTRLAAGVVLLALTGCGPSEYTLKTKDRTRGDIEQVSIMNTVRREMTAVADSGKVLKEQQTNTTETVVYTETILEKPDTDKPATRRSREYETAQISEGEQRNLTLPYQGKSVLIEKKKDKWHYRINNALELTGEWAKYLDNEFAKRDEIDEPVTLLFPKEPIKAGASWPLDMERLVKQYEKLAPAPIDTAQATGTGKLVRVYRNEGAQFGVIEVALEMPLKEQAQGAMQVGPGSKLTLNQTIDACIDGAVSTGKWNTVMKLTVNASVPQGKVIISAEGNYQRATKDMTNK
jgi:hypothetical protein